MLDRDSIFGDFSDEAFSRGMCKLITKKTLSLLQYHKTRHEDFQKILNPYANQKILDDIKIKVFDDFSEKGVANGVDRLIDTILREHLFYYPKSKAINPLVFGDFSEEAIINAVTQIIDERILASFIEIPINTQSQPKKQTTYNSTNANQYVYILYNEILYQEYNTHIYKIGWTSRTPQIRADEISQGTGVVGKWKVGHQWKVEDGHWLEQEIFKHFAQYRLPYSEQFNFKGQTLEKVAEQISRFINNHGESPKRAAEIAAKELKERKQKKKLEEEQQRAKYAYDAECNKIKIEIQNIQHSNLEKALKNDTELKEYFYICMFISFIIGTGISLHNGKGFIVWVVLCLIIGWVFYFFKKDSKYHEIKNKYLTPLSDNLEQLKKIRDEISKIDTTPHQNKLSSNTINHTSTKEQQFPDTTEINTPNPQPKNEDKIPVGVMVFLGILVFFGLVGIMEELNKDNRSSSQTKYTPPQPPVSEPQEETPIPQEEQQPDIVNTQQPQEIPTQVIEQNPPIKQSPQTKPKEVYTPPQNNSVSPEYLAAEQAHFNKILAAHPDAIAIVESQAFKNWVNNQSASNQSYYNNVLNNGSATQVINMFNQYKKDLRSPPNNQQTISNPPQPQKRTSQDIYEQYQKPLIPSADKPLTIQSVENMPEME